MARALSAVDWPFSKYERVSTLSFILFGIDTGFWTVIYVLVGGVSGEGRRLRHHWIIRFLSTSIVFTILILIAIVVFSWLARVSWREVKNMLEGFYSFALFAALTMG